ncbi:RNA-directed DNA polymerase from mobile element jockey-like [Brachionus plicatilis]|uniref:RNA-directed DNA polymerase from mobile element jockey-like n=1 Tax=Brachionus plicatilis TaxID=10195 RepID=A0A3M7SUI4_BRAPC|nr:RNA-directed DNA polymerase from mobile element jockey-like [Brachionus plicatilis]
MIHTSVARNLGIFLTDDVKWTHRAAQSANKTNAVLGQLKQAFKCWSKSSFKQLYMSFVRLHLEHAVASWSPCPKRES